jgi:DNA-binding response OmpR family regulator
MTSYPTTGDDAMAGRPRLLLTDDDQAIRDSLTPFLARCGFEVVQAADGPECLAIVERTDRRPDLVVLDVMMPGLDGREVLRRIRTQDAWLPVILLTQVNETFERVAALNEGADDYLNKPFDPQELLARIRGVLRRAQHGQPPLTVAERLVSGAVHLNRTARTASIDGRTAALTPRAFALLEFLMSHPGELCTRERLLERVWGYENPVTTRAVDHRIAELRKVLGDDTTQGALIETAPGVGYRFTGAVVRG